MAALESSPAYKLAQELTRKAKALAELRLPQGSEHHYHHSTSETYRQAVATLKQEAVKLIASCQDLTKDAITGPWPDQDDAQEAVTACLDELLTLVDTALDRHKKGDPVQQIPSTFTSLAATSSAGWTAVHSSSGKRAMGHAPGIRKPQESFNPKVDNSTDPFVHWAAHLEGIASQPPPSLRQLDHATPQHPLQPQLDALTFPAWQLEAPEPIAPRPLEDTPFTWVDTPEALQHMVQQLSRAQHVAIDLENHSFRSFQGFTCLMQVSTREADWVVDTLSLRAHLGPALARLFADPNIVKVLHGSDHDVLWLQRDFHLYLVNTFDTGQAARVLSLTSASLAHLLDHYCGVTADKRFQLADWRVRPLTDEMLHYARVDTHYLLYIHDRLKQQLLELKDQVPPSLVVPITPGLMTSPDQTALLTVLQRSKQICATLYTKDLITQESTDQLIIKWQLTMAPVQKAVLHALLMWRDKVAREEDEGTGYVLPKTPLVALARNVPGTAAEVLRMASQNHQSVPEPVKRRLNEVVTCILSAKTTALNHKTSPAVAAPAVALVADPGQPGRSDGTGLAAAQVLVPVLQPASVPKIQRKSATAKAAATAAESAPAAAAAQPSLAAADPTEDQPVVAAEQPSSIPTLLAATAAAPIVKKSKTKASAFASTLSKRPASGSTVILNGAAGAGQDEQAAARAAAQLRSTFTLPFSLQPALTSSAAAGSQGAGQAEQQEAEQMDEDEGAAAAPRTSGADVRALVDAMRAGGGAPDIVIGSDGQAVADGEQGEEQAAQQQQEQAEEAEVEVEQAADLIPVDMHRGEDVGLPEMDYVPMSLNELKRGRIEDGERVNRVKHKTVATWGLVGAAAPDAAGPRSKKLKSESKVQYTTELQSKQEQEAARLEKEKQDDKQIRSLFGEDEEQSESESDDQAPEQLPISREMLRKPVQLGQPVGGRGARGGRGGVAGARGQKPSRPVAQGDRKPAFNPYDIPDDNLLKGGKRSAVMPRSGNRTMTFKK